jgi:hypothetical protein
LRLAQPRLAPAQHSVAGAATAFVFGEVAAASGPAEVLGRFPTACYVQLTSGAVIAVLTADAIALPIGVVLSSTSGTRPLDAGDDPIAIEAGRVVLGSLTIEVCPTRRAELPRVGTPNPEAIDHARRLVRQHRAYADVGALASLATEELLGRGPGLTPAGDDLLCGRLGGSRLFGSYNAEDGEDAATAGKIEQALLSRPRATTSLSRALLLRALAGEGLSQLGEFGYALAHDEASVPEAFEGLAAVGHSSGLALAMGVLDAAECAAL